MDLHNKELVDYAVPLQNESHESFCQSYVELDIDKHVVNKRARRVRAYRTAFPNTETTTESVVNSRASVLLRNANIISRIDYLYEENGSSVENKHSWDKNKSTDALLEIIYNEGLKTADRVNAIKELNKMIGIDVPKVDIEEDKTDSISSFFKKFRGDSDG